MMQFVRTGPELVIIKPVDRKKFEQFAKAALIAREYSDQDLSQPVNFHVLFDQLRDNSTILFVTDDVEDSMKTHVFEQIFITNFDLTYIALSCLNSNVKVIEEIRRSARVLFLKTVGDIERVIDCVMKDFAGEKVDSTQLYELRNKGVIIHFTPENIDRTIRFKDLHPQAVYVEGDGRETYLELAKRAIRYVNIGMRNKFWYELDIKIYDSYGHYECHYDRLQYVLNKLDIGVLAGETWGTDAATSFWSVDTYNMRIFTYMEPKAFKAVLLGLEYAGDGERKVDFDLYYRKKKISWTAVRGKGNQKREEVGMASRQNILDQLDEDDKKYLQNLELQIKTSVK